MARTTHHLKIPSSTQHLEEVRAFVEEYARAADLSSDTVEHFKIAVDEACTNVIKHSYGGDDSQEINISILVDPDLFTVRIRDNGRAFNPQAYREPDIFQFAKNRRSGGFGVHIMRRLMDRVEYRKRGPVNEVHLTKYRNNHAVEQGREAG